MRRITRIRPSYAGVTATLALVFALGLGGAYAAQKLGSKQIAPSAVKSKHIKDGQVKTHDVAAGLSVTSAENAADADRLDGIDSAVLTPATAASRTDSVTLTETDQTVLSATIPTEASMRLAASASTRLMGNGGDNDTAICALWFDSEKDDVDYSTTIPDTTNDTSALSPVALAAVPAGTHNVELRCREGTALGNDVSIVSAGMTVTGHLYPSS